MFDEKEALKLLCEDRRAYLEKAVKYIQSFLDSDMDELAANTLIEAATGLKQLDGTLQYIKQLGRFNDNGYPRFNTIISD